MNDATEVDGAALEPADVAAAGHLGDRALVERAIASDDGSLRRLGLGALLRIGELNAGRLTGFATDADPAVRRRVAELAPRLDDAADTESTLVTLLRDDAEIAEVEKLYPNPHHPVIRTHPETGRKGIYVNSAFTKEIDGMDADESDRLLQLLYTQASYPEYQVRLIWQPNTIAFWDNRSVQHYAASDYYPQVRRVERVTIVGDAPYYDASQAPAELPPRPFMGQIELRRKGYKHVR